MEIQINTGSNIEGVDEFARRVEEEIETVLGRFSDQITRIEVHLNDENAEKNGGSDKRCLIEARLAGRDPEAVTHNASSIEQAYAGAAKKLRRVLDARLGKLNDHKGGDSIRKADQ
jgi:ribosome-associated translation inhibitor RaiA